MENLNTIYGIDLAKEYDSSNTRIYFLCQLLILNKIYFNHFNSAI